MTIFKRVGAFTVTGAALASVLALSASSALAASSHGATATWTVKPGGAITAKAGVTTLKDTKTGSTLTCQTSSSSGKLKSGSGLSGTGIGSITALSFSNCSGPLGLTFTVQNSNFPWHLNATSFSGGVTKGTITGIKSHLSGTSCSADVAGNTASTPATVNVTYTNSTGALKVVSGGTLHVWNVSGCAALINSGDPTQFSGSYTVSPKQTVTSP